MERPAGWKVLTLGAALAGIGVAGADAAPAEPGSPGRGPAYVSPAPLFNDESRLLASGGHGHGGHGHWGPGWGSPGWGSPGWGPGWFPNVSACISATGPFGNVSGSVCV
jgi:hypothetical protein